MGSWSFLTKKIIHTIITLFVVLILLFIIFRLMPGDPTKFFIKPGMDENAKHLLAERWGFERRVPTPGNEYELKIETPYPGAFGVNISAEDNAGSKTSYYGVYVHSGYLEIDENTTVYSVDAAPNTDGTVTVNLALVEVNYIANFSVNLTHDDSLVETINLIHTQNSTQTIGTETETICEYSGKSSTAIDLTSPGNFFINFTAKDITSGAPIVNLYGFSINKNADALKPFSIDTLTMRPTDSASESKLVLNVSSVNGIKEVKVVTVTSPLGMTSPPPSDIMTHSFHFIPVPYWEQFGIYLKNMLTMDFGNSFSSGQPVWDELLVRIPATMLLFGSSLITAALLGILLGVLMAWRRGTKGELAGIVISLFFNTMPLFWFGLILLAIFSYTLGWFPLAGWATPGADYVGLDYIADLLHHLALPLITLTIAHLAGWMLLMRNSMLEVMGEDYIMTAKAKGLSERKIMYKHAARNAMLPTVTSIAMSIGGVVGGGVLTETIFSWPGMGLYLFRATVGYNYPAVQGAFFLLAILTILGNFFADIVYSYLDPRVRLSR